MRFLLPYNMLTPSDTREAEHLLWKLGDKIIDVCGEPAASGEQNDSFIKIDNLAKFLKQSDDELEGNYSSSFLRQLRDTSHKFHAHDRCHEHS